MKSVLILGDLHAPFINEKAVKEAVYLHSKNLKPDTVLQIGDLYDQYGFSRFSRKNIELPDSELKRGREVAEDLWKSVQARRPGARCIQILGNHDIRAIKRAQEKLPEAQDLVRESILELYRFKGVETVEDDRDTTQVDGIVFHHGWLSRSGDHMRYFGRSTVVGHSHTGGTVFEQRHGRTLWELNCGYLADEESEPLRYNPVKISKWTTGFGLITYRKKTACPQFIPV